MHRGGPLSLSDPTSVDILREKLSIGWKSFVVRVNELLNNGKGSISVKKSGLPAVEMG